jgi:hypothetical protein
MATTLPSGPSLGEKDMALLNAGKLVLVLNQNPGFAWPQIIVHKKTKAPPELVASVFLDYKNTPKYMKRVLSVDLLSSSDSVDIVKYKIKLPFFATFQYTAKNRLKINEGAWIIEWELLDSPLASYGRGEFRAAPLEGGTLVSYASQVEPANKLVAALKSQAIAEVKETITSLVSESENRMPASLQQPLQKLEGSPVPDARRR